MPINIELNKQSLETYASTVLNIEPESVERISNAFQAFWQGDIALEDLPTLAKRCHLSRMDLVAFSEYIKVRAKLVIEVEVFVLLTGTKKHMERTWVYDNAETEEEKQREAMSYYYGLVDDLMLKYLAEKSIKQFSCVAVSHAVIKDQAEKSPDIVVNEHMIDAVQRPMNIDKMAVTFRKSSERLEGYQ
jgi:hypothetical protein